jgi:quercetin dioxygenase-like cupin family protein
MSRDMIAFALDEIRAEADGSGVLWALGGERQLEVNVVALEPGGAIDAHRNNEVDVLIVVLGGAGTLRVDDDDRALEVHTLAVVPRDTTRAITAGAVGMRYLSIHTLRPPPSIGRRPD